MVIYRDINRKLTLLYCLSEQRKVGMLYIEIYEQSTETSSIVRRSAARGQKI